MIKITIAEFTRNISLKYSTFQLSDLLRYHFNFLDKPSFLAAVEGDEIKEPFEVEEGKSRVINLTAIANPPKIEYKWSRGKVSIPKVSDALPESRLVALSNGQLNISNVRREDAGAYKVKAENSEGKTKIKFKLNVLYAPRYELYSNQV